MRHPISESDGCGNGEFQKIVDGFLLQPGLPFSSILNAEKNQAEFPHPRAQEKGVGLPIARSVASLSLATAIVMEVVLGPHKGKKTAALAPLRQLMPSFRAGDVVVSDRCYCSFMMIAQLRHQRVDVCARLMKKPRNVLRAELRKHFS